VANLALHDRQRQLVQVHVVHDVAVPERVDRQLVERAPTPVTTVLAVDPGRPYVAREELAQAILRVAPLRSSTGVEQELGRARDPHAALGHAALAA